MQDVDLGLRQAQQSGLWNVLVMHKTSQPGEPNKFLPIVYSLDDAGVRAALQLGAERPEEWGVRTHVIEGPLSV